MKFIKTIGIHVLTFAPFLYANAAAPAATLKNPLKAQNITQLLNAILDIVVLIGVPVLVMAIIWVGFMYVRAQGKPEDIKTANSAFFWTVIGAGVVLGAKIISLAIQSTVKDLGA